MNFAKLAAWCSEQAGSPIAFASALACVMLWAASGPLFAFSDTWQLIINTSTTIVTCLMTFLIQASQNCDTKAIQAKLDELIRSHREASNSLIGLEKQRNGPQS
jgi:low affinity Fe/Cu permease